LKQNFFGIKIISVEMKNRIAENVAIDGNKPNKILLKMLPLYQILTKNEGAFLSLDLKN